jgi:hypothetical protein
VLEFASILLNSSDCSARTKLCDAFGPLTGQELFVNDDKGPNTKACCNSKSAYSLPKANIERKNSIALVQAQCLKLNVAEIARERD